MIPAYLLLLELGKRLFYRLATPAGAPVARPPMSNHRRIHRRASRWTASRPA